MLHVTTAWYRAMVAVVQPEVEVRMRHHSHTFLLLLAFLVAGGCDKSNSDGTEPSQTQQAPNDEKGSEEAPTGKFSLKLKVSGTAETYQIEGALKPEEMQSALEAALYAQEAFEKGGPRELTGTVTYDVKTLPDGEAGHEVVLFGALNSPSANFSAGVQHQSTDETWAGQPLGAMIEGAAEKFATQIGAQARVVGGDDDALFAILQNTEEPEPARLMAIQEIRERGLTQHIEELRKYLDAEQPEQLRLAAAAALVSLGDKESRTEIIKLAEDMSRDRNPKYVPMLHILGDLGGEEVTTYLETVAEAHSAPAVRTVAEEALKKARGANK